LRYFGDTFALGTSWRQAEAKLVALFAGRLSSPNPRVGQYGEKSMAAPMGSANVVRASGEENMTERKPDGKVYKKALFMAAAGMALGAVPTHSYAQTE